MPSAIASFLKRAAGPLLRVPSADGAAGQAMITDGAGHLSFGPAEPAAHDHDGVYAPLAHSHDGVYAPVVHAHDHGALGGLSDDDHSQYLLLAGRSGGQSIAGKVTAQELEVGSEAHFGSEVDNGNSGTASTIDWRAGNKQALTLTGSCTLTFTDPRGAASLILRLVQDGTGGRTAIWPSTVKWPGGEAPTLSTDPGTIDIVSLYFDGTSYYAQAALNFA